MLMQEEGRKREGVVHVKNLKDWTLPFRFCNTTSGLCNSRLLLEAEGNARQWKKFGGREECKTTADSVPHDLEQTIFLVSPGENVEGH
jgi:hypothetical protein